MSNDLIAQLQLLRSAERRFGSGEYLFQRGDPVAVLHVIEEGEVHLLRHQQNGTSLTLQRAGPGAVLAEASLYADVYHCDAVAQRTARTFAVPCRALQKALAAEPNLSRAWTAHLAAGIWTARLRAEILSLRTVAARLDAWFDANPGREPGRGDWTTIATEIGVSPPALYRELATRRRPLGPE